MARQTGDTNARPTRSESVAIQRSMKERALAGDTHAQLALANHKLADAIEGTASLLVTTAPEHTNNSAA